MSEVKELRDHEGRVLRPRWNSISRAAEVAAGVLNWESADGDDWNRNDAVAYSNAVVRWAVQVTRVLEAADPAGTSGDPDYISLRTTWNFHVAKVIHLQGLGISTPRVPSDLEAVWSGIKDGIIRSPENLLSLLGYAALAVLAVFGVVLLAKSN